MRWWLRKGCARGKEKKALCENNFKFATAVDLSKCLNRMKSPILTYTCASISELPSDIGTKIQTPLQFDEYHGSMECIRILNAVFWGK